MYSQTHKFIEVYTRNNKVKPIVRRFFFEKIKTKDAIKIKMSKITKTFKR